MGRKLILENIKTKLKEINPNIEIISDEYINNSTKLKCLCLIDGQEFESIWSNLQRGHGCPKCGGSLKLTMKEIKERVKCINPNIEIVSDVYKNAHTKFKCKCKIDNHEFESTWAKLQIGRGCPKCSKNEKLTLEVIKEKLLNINPNIKILSNEYINAQSKLKCKCLICGCEWNINWSNLNNGKSCPSCANKIRNILTKLTIEDVKEKLKIKNANIEIISTEYISNQSKMKCKCKIDNHEWEANWNNLSNGNGCPMCKSRNMFGKNHPNWKGGITPLHNYLRTHLLQWRKDSFKKYNYKCDITGVTNADLVIHHHYNFSDILKETVTILNLQIYEEVNKYSQEELQSIEELCLKLHYKYGLGVCLTENIHNEFHSIYGRENNTLEQYLQFKENKLRKEVV